MAVTRHIITGSPPEPTGKGSWQSRLHNPVARGENGSDSFAAKGRARMIIRRRPTVADMHRMGPGFAGYGWTGALVPGVNAVRQCIPVVSVPVAPLFSGFAP